MSNTCSLFLELGILFFGNSHYIQKLTSIQVNHYGLYFLPKPITAITVMDILEIVWRTVSTSARASAGTSERSSPGVC